MRASLGRLCAGWLVLAGASASAASDPNNLLVYQFGDPRTVAGANTDFRIFAREFGAAISSTTLTPPETLGHSGFATNVELSVLNLDARDVTSTSDEGFVLPTQTGAGSNPALKPLLIPSIHVRKGFPFSFEVGARAAWIDRSNMAVGTLEAKYAINEGFLYLPDVSIRGYVTRLFNTRDFDLTTFGFDLGVGREFPIGGMITLTPYAGYNLGFVSASSNQVVFNRTLTPAESVASPYAVLQGSAVYAPVHASDNTHSRFYAGLRFIGGVIQLGVEASFVSLGKISMADDPTLTADRSLPAVTTIATTLGLDF